MITFYGLSWLAGGNDIIATTLHLSISQITYALRVLILLGPVMAFVITKRWCISLQRHDLEVLLHGRETGSIVRSPDGGYSEDHQPLSPAKAYTLVAAGREQAIQAPTVHETHGVPPHNHLTRRLRHRLSQAMFADNLARPQTSGHGELGSHAEHENGSCDTSQASGTTTDGHA